ncbi:efflux RND transporter periplasmic adaptor subunit [Arachidicoccus sp.]|uniref:efflux RND transporter periplasmic adaptor subunit n=1 Tax=Arachidicoccus sp. TaxID=1872624 RepID=UPI003D257CA2
MMSFENIRKITGASLLVLFASCSSQNNKTASLQANPAVYVSVDTVRSANAQYFEEYPGTVTAFKQIALTSQVNGYIKGIYFKDGQNVEKGQKLYAIDAQVYDANYQNAVAQLEVQKANLTKAQKDAERYHELDKQDAIAKQQVDYADAALLTAQKQVAAAKAAVNAVNANVQFSTIYAPFSGSIGISNVQVGTAVVAGQTVLNTISTNNPIAVDFNIDQSQLYRFEQLRTKVNDDSLFTIVFGTDVYPESGHIASIDRAVDQTTGTIKIRLSFDNKDNLLKPGMSNIVRVKNNSGNKSILIPAKALTEQLGEFFVYLVGDSSKVTQQKVQIGQTIGSNVIIAGGLNVGQEIVVEGQQKLHEGSTITTTQNSGSQK